MFVVVGVLVDDDVDDEEEVDAEEGVLEKDICTVSSFLYDVWPSQLRNRYLKSPAAAKVRMDTDRKTATSK